MKKTQPIKIKATDLENQNEETNSYNGVGSKTGKTNNTSMYIMIALSLLCIGIIIGINL